MRVLIVYDKVNFTKRNSYMSHDSYGKTLTKDIKY